jgi:D-3-phosphoglycerate dehydrogenase / 2-oxoglutarate reductase
MTPKVFVFAPTGDSHKHLEENGCAVTLGDPQWHIPGADYEADYIRATQGSVALAGTSMRATPTSRAVLASLPDLRIVAKATVGVDDIDVEAASELGILVTHAPVESNWGNIAETTVMFLLSLLKGQNVQDQTIKDGGWWSEAGNGKYVGSRSSDGYKGITLGIVGLGRIGMRVAQLMRPWNINILASDPYIPEYRFLEAGVKPVDLDTLLEESDVVTIHVVLNRETKHMISAPQLEKMKPSAFLINTARGGAVDEQALINALDKGMIAGAALNAYEEEPLSAESPLRFMGNKVILRPHGGSPLRTQGAEAPAGRGAGQNSQWVNADILKALRGETPDHIFNAEALPLWLERFKGEDLFRQ